MVKSLSLSILILFLCGCGGFYSIPSGHIDPEFQSYVDDYKKDKLYYLNSTKFKRLSITFRPLDNLDGVCEILSFNNIITKKETMSYRRIFVDPDTWSYSSNVERMLLIYHELGHCDLNLEHSYENTIMNEYGISENDFIKDPVYYFTLLFKEGK